MKGAGQTERILATLVEMYVDDRGKGETYMVSAAI